MNEKELKLYSDVQLRRELEEREAAARKKEEAEQKKAKIKKMTSDLVSAGLIKKADITKFSDEAIQAIQLLYNELKVKNLLNDKLSSTARCLRWAVRQKVSKRKYQKILDLCAEEMLLGEM